MQSTTQPKTKSQIKPVVIALLVVLALLCHSIFSFFLVHIVNLPDRLHNLTYTAPADISALASSLPLTDHAKIIFDATRPQLESRAEFNEHCESHDEAISVLGCYVNGRIYLYDVRDSELAGVVESTATHELLHAVWDRLSFWERAALEPELRQVYRAYQTKLSGDLELYEDEDQLDELHSRIGVEIKDLPETLEKHYAKYFTDQDAVVDFYDSYSEPFRALSEEIDTLSDELETARAEIDAKTQDYYTQAEALTAKIEEFNNCANTAGCFASDTDFYARRNTLAAEQDALEDLYSELNDQIDQYNEKVNQYNNNILRTQTLENAINSNAPVDAL